MKTKDVHYLAKQIVKRYAKLSGLPGLKLPDGSKITFKALYRELSQLEASDIEAVIYCKDCNLCNRAPRSKTGTCFEPKTIVEPRFYCALGEKKSKERIQLDETIKRKLREERVGNGPRGRKNSTKKGQRRRSKV